MAPGTGPTVKINAAELTPPPPAQQYCDTVTAEIERIVTAAVTLLKLAARLSANGYSEIRTISGLDDPNVPEQDRKGRIETAARNEVTALLAAARTKLAAFRNPTKEANLGFTPASLTAAFDTALVNSLNVAVEGEMSNSLKELIQKRTEYAAERAKEAKNIATDMAAAIAHGLDNDDRRELRTVLKTRKIGMSSVDRGNLIRECAESKARDASETALSTLDSKVSFARATSLGLNVDETRETAKGELIESLRKEIVRKLKEGYDTLCRESEERAMARSSAWGYAKWGSLLTVGAATYATIAVIGGTSAVFWVPVGVVVATATFGFCHWRQSATSDKYLK
jgi:hypothetical protein